MKYQRVAAVPHLRRGVPDRSTVYSIAKYVPAVGGVASCPGSLRGGKLSLVHTVRACANIYGKESVNVSVNDLSHVVRSSTEQHACIVSGRTRN